MLTTPLSLAVHEREHLYWEGGHYELNMSFDSLRDKQWQRLIQAMWTLPQLTGPLETRFHPGVSAAKIAIAIPPPTATMTQHGQLGIASGAVGCDVLSTRSLFECVSLLVPLGMFATNHPSTDSQPIGKLTLTELDDVLSRIALSIYEVVPFRLAAIGYERECQVVTELLSDTTTREQLLAEGGFFAQEDVFQLLNAPLEGTQAVRSGLRWMPPHRA